jgi:hypothetical protein
MSLRRAYRRVKFIVSFFAKAKIAVFFVARKPEL